MSFLLCKALVTIGAVHTATLLEEGFSGTDTGVPPYPVVPDGRTNSLGWCLKPAGCLLISFLLRNAKIVCLITRGQLPSEIQKGKKI